MTNPLKEESQYERLGLTPSPALIEKLNARLDTLKEESQMHDEDADIRAQHQATLEALEEQREERGEY